MLLKGLPKQSIFYNSPFVNITIFFQFPVGGPNATPSTAPSTSRQFLKLSGKKISNDGIAGNGRP